jgi:hypothetical protein
VQIGNPAALSRPNRRSPTRRPGAKARTRHPWRVPFGLLPIRAAMLGAADGGKAESQSQNPQPEPRLRFVGCAPRTVSFDWHGIGAQCAPYIVMCARSAHTLGAMPQASRLCLSNPFVSPSNAARGGIARRGRAMDGAHSSVGTGTCRRKTIRQDCRIAQPQAARRARYMDVPSAPAPGE